MAESTTKSVEKVEAVQDEDRQRSPAYPSIPLEEAINKVKTIYAKDKGASGTMEVIASHLESSPKSSGFNQAISSIVRYGLLDEMDGKPRRLKVSKIALDIILLPESDPKRISAIRASALAPKPFKDLWENHGTNLPSEQNLIHTLVTEKQFKHGTAERLIRQYKKTIDFAKLGQDDKIENEEGDEVKIGDYVLWDSQGVAQFTEPKRVRWISDDGLYVAVDGGMAGLPINEVKRVDPPKDKVVPMNASNPAVIQSVPPLPPPDTSKSVAAMSQDTFTIGGSVALIRWPEKLTAEQFADLQDWIELQLRKTARESGIPVPKKN